MAASYDDFFEHTEGDGAKMFKAVSRLGLEGIVSNKLTRIDPIEKLDQDQESEATHRNSRYRWDVLIGRLVWVPKPRLLRASINMT